MATEVKSKGSIIYKILIVILAVALVGTILYPKKLWKAEEANQEICRDNLEHILYVEYAYLSAKNVFTDTLAKAVELIKSDTTGAMLRQFIHTDSLLSTKIIDYLKKLDYVVRVDSIGDSTRLVSPEKAEGKLVLDATIPSPVDSSMVDSAMVEKGGLIDFVGFLDRLEDHTRFNGIDTVEAFILDSCRTFPGLPKIIDSLGLYTLNHLGKCPTVGRDYLIQVVDTSAIKIVNIYCPLDEDDSLTVLSDLKLSKIGGLKIGNHGSIENGEKSWAK